MGAKKPEKSWQERLNEGAPADPEPVYVAKPEEPFVPSPELTEAMTRALNAEHKARAMEVRAMVLERELYLAKAKILDLEIEKIERAHP